MLTFPQTGIQGLHEWPMSSSAGRFNEPRLFEVDIILSLVVVLERLLCNYPTTLPWKLIAL